MKDGRSETQRFHVIYYPLPVITDILNNPSIFIHYAKRRVLLERSGINLEADEIELLGFYIDQNLYFERGEYTENDYGYLLGYHSIIDKYITEKHEMGKECAPLRQEMSKEYAAFISDVEEMDVAYKTDCIMFLLDLGSVARKQFMDHVIETKNKTINDGLPHTCSHRVNETWLSFIALGNNNRNRLEEEVEKFALWKLSSTDAIESICFIWDTGSSKEVDAACYVKIQQL